MLAQNFKTADELGLIDDAYLALIKVLGMLERGELIHTPRGRPIPHGFNMKTVWEQEECGTVGCIAGWARAVGLGDVGLGNAACFLNTDFNPSQGFSLNKLFMPDGYTSGRHTVEQAAHALRTYLVTGHPDWS